MISLTIGFVQYIIPIEIQAWTKSVVELRSLRYFVAVAEELHFGRAARRLNLTQPPLSLQIRRLEETLGVTLLLRTKRHVALTPAGRVLLDEARQILARLEHAMAATRQAARGEAGRLAVGFMHSTAYALLPLILRQFRDDFPDVELILLEMTVLEQTEALRHHRIDVGVLRPPVNDPGLRSEVISGEPFVVALPPRHPLARARAVALQALGDDPFVMFPRDLSAGFHRVTVERCRAAGFAPKIAQEAAHIHTIIGLVGAGLGVALVPASARKLAIPGVIFRPLAEPAPRAEIALAWRRDDPSPILVNFLRTAQETSAGH
jgi:DNA-binding transcriptional LysR family regulator